MNGIEKIETKRQTYQTLREKSDVVDENPSPTNVSTYDAIVEIRDQRYGVSFEEGQAKAEAELRDAGATVYSGRESRGSLSAGILSDDLEEITVEEAVNQNLEESSDQENVSIEESPTAGRYGFDRAVSN